MVFMRLILALTRSYFYAIVSCRLAEKLLSKIDMFLVRETEMADKIDCISFRPPVVAPVDAVGVRFFTENGKIRNFSSGDDHFMSPVCIQTAGDWEDFERFVVEVVSAIEKSSFRLEMVQDDFRTWRRVL